jgi:signal transduction histidine kinase
MSTSNRINENCVLRRNLKVQPYGRCSVCALPLRGCHAWQASLLSFGMIILALGATLVPGGLWLRLVAIGIIGLVVAEGLANHRRTDHLINTEHQLRSHNARLARAVDEATFELREANRALATSNLELLENDKLRESFIANLTHDLRTPLTSIKGAADNLLDGIAGPLGTEQQEYIEIVRDHSRRLTSQVNELLAAGRLQAARVEVHASPVEVRGLVDDVVRGLEPIARERGIAVEVLGKPERTVADREKLRVAVENLAANALKFTDAGGSVTVEIRPDDARLVIAVRDTGRGIPADHLPRLFERYYRGSEDRPGSGLGLSIARNLVRLNGGEIEVSSEVGRGSEFRVFLPRLAGAA